MTILTDVSARDINQVITQGIPPEQFQRLAEELGVTRTALTSFFKNFEQQQVPPEDLDAKLREIATHYNTLLERVRTLSTDDPTIVQLRDEAEAAIQEGDFDRAEQLLNDQDVPRRAVSSHPFLSKLLGAVIGAAIGCIAGLGLGFALNPVHQTGLALFVMSTCSLASIFPGIRSGTNPKAIALAVVVMVMGSGVGALAGALLLTSPSLAIHDFSVFGWWVSSLLAGIVNMNTKRHLQKPIRTDG